MDSPCPRIPFTISPSVSSTLSLPTPEFLCSRPEIKDLLAGTLVFRTGPSGQLQVLLLRRAATDTFPLRWEIPCGGLSAPDVSPLACAVRELWEETGLHASHIQCTVGMITLPEHLPRDKDIDQAETQDGDDTCLVSLWAEGQRWHVLTVIVDVQEDLNGDGVDGKSIVRLRPEEHEAWMWVTEEQVRRGIDADGRVVEFVSETARRVVLEGFRSKLTC